MAKLVVTEYISIDGVNDEPGNWSMPYFDADMMQFKKTELFSSDVQLLGHITYEGFAAAWPTFPSDPEGFTDRMNSMPKCVVSTTLKDPTWTNTRVISGNVVEEINKLRAAPGGDILVAGSGTLVRFLAANELVDEYRFALHPIVLGAGKRVFDENSPMQGMKLQEAKTFGSGIVLLTYTRDNK